MINRLFTELRTSNVLSNDYINIFREISLSFLETHRASILEDHLSTLIDELAETLNFF